MAKEKKTKPPKFVYNCVRCGQYCSKVVGVPVHFKDINPEIKQHVIENRIGFYDACGQGIFCNLGDGDVDFPKVR